MKPKYWVILRCKSLNMNWTVQWTLGHKKQHFASQYTTHTWNVRTPEPSGLATWFHKLFSPNPKTGTKEALIRSKLSLPTHSHTRISREKKYNHTKNTHPCFKANFTNPFRFSKVKSFVPGWASKASAAPPTTMSIELPGRGEERLLVTAAWLTSLKPKDSSNSR